MPSEPAASDSVVPDATFFVDRLHRAVNTIRPWVSRSLVTKTTREPAYRNGLRQWAAKQGIANFGDDEFYASVASQITYRFLGKVIFYETLRRSQTELPKLDLHGVDDAVVLSRFRSLFERARQIDYQAIFEEDIIDQVPFPQAAVNEARTLTEDLNRYNFYEIPQDVIGQVYERLIPPEERRGLGQYFTREELVDLILAICVRSCDDAVLDPTCGSGTFLVRAYDLLRSVDGHDHSRLLDQLWGVDVARFPAQLATINLFRQDLTRVGNFPRILPADFFDLKPGSPVSFPSSTAVEGGEVAWAEEAFPVFDVIVGNFPYIRQEDIERQVQGYKQKIERVLAGDWHATGDYRDLFDRKGRCKLSGLADVYAYLFMHAGRFLKPGGRMGIVTSNAWLDVNYGFELQRFFLNNFKILAILESRCEPWFDQVSMNTVVTVVERCENQEERDRHLAAFVKVQKPLGELLRGAGAAPRQYWEESANELHQAMDPTDAQEVPGDERIAQAENEAFRCRFVRQEALLAELQRTRRTVKWGRYLRAPDVYFDWLGQAADRGCFLGDIARPFFGSKTRINQFFHVRPEMAERFEIGDEFLVPLFKSPKEVGTMAIDPDSLELRVFVCRVSKEGLRKEKKLGTLRYIEWGESQVYSTGVQKGMPWPDGPWVKNRQPGWWALPPNETNFGQLFLAMAYGERHTVRFSREPVIPDNRLYYLSPKDGASAELIAAVMNSSLVALSLELSGRVTLGDGVLEVKVEDARDYLLVPDVRQFTPREADSIVSAFRAIARRPVKSVFEEVEMTDRRRLDAVVLEALGLDPDLYLERIYEGLCLLVRERLDLATKRKKAQKTKPQRDVTNVREAVTAECLGEGPRRFPQDFLDYEAVGDRCKEVPLPKEPLRFGAYFFGSQEVVADGGYVYKATTPAEAKFIVYSQLSGHPVARIPTEPLTLVKAVSAYEVYLRGIRSELFESLTQRTMNQKMASRLLGQIWSEAGLPEVDEGR